MAVNEDPGILLYTRIRKSPYFHASREHGVARYSVYNHTYHPRHYGDPVAEYWLHSTDLSVFAVVEAESTEPLAAIRMEWDDVFEIDVFPVVTAEEGLERLRRTMSFE